MSNPISFNLESLPDFAREALMSLSAAPTPPKSVKQFQQTPAWTLLLDAAVVGTFLPRELGPKTISSTERSESEKVVLEFAEMVHGPSGARWSLTSDARRDVLTVAIASGEVSDALQRTRRGFSDLFSQALRTFLSGASTMKEAWNLDVLEAMRLAASALAGISGVQTPALESLESQIEFRRIMAPFQRMVRQVRSSSGKQATDRFYGRDRELERLRDYVNVVQAQSLGQSISRLVSNVWRAIQGRKPLVIWGIGGSGKTTLISKFMLEHAEAATSRFPFAYLDFDRTTISARSLSSLISEMCLQVGAQFPALSQSMDGLRTEVLQVAHRLALSGELEWFSYFHAHIGRFRTLVDNHLSQLESALEWSRPFLLVLDTFEIVQYSQDDVSNLEQFVQGFTRHGDEGLWPRLRLIISGRKQVTHFSGPVEDLPLGVLEKGGSAELMAALADDAGKPISSDEAGRLVAAVAKATGERSGGVHPLRLHLIGEVFRKNPDTGEKIVQSLINEFKQPLSAEGLATTQLIDGMLIRRIVDHVADPRVQALADPGLVVRRITPDVIRKVMTLSSIKPRQGGTQATSGETAEPWVIDQTEAEDIFNSFKKEVSLVEQDGDSLRHRADVRLQMLPLIRARRPEQFERLNRTAYAFFQENFARDPSNLADAAEMIYHGLWTDQPLEELDRVWPRRPGFDPRIDPAEFGRGSPANVFIRAKANATLTPGEVSRLPAEVALDWLDTRSPDLLKHRNIDDSIDAIRSAAGVEFDRLGNRPGTAAVLARLFYRAGFWDDASRLAWRHLDGVSLQEPGADWNQKGGFSLPQDPWNQAHTVSLLRTYATIVTRSAALPGPWPWILNIVGQVADPLVRAEIAANLTIRFKVSRTPTSDERAQLNAILNEAVDGVEPSQWRSEPRVLRLVGAAGRQDLFLLQSWIEAREQVPREVETDEVKGLLAEVLKKAPAAAEIRRISRKWERTEILEKLDEIWRHEKPQILESVSADPDCRPQFWRMALEDRSDWIRSFGNALARELKGNIANELLDSLSENSFLDGQSGIRRQRDGVSITKTAYDQGRFQELAALVLTLAPKPRRSRSAPVATLTYPQNVFELSAAMQEWGLAIHAVKRTRK